MLPSPRDGSELSHASCKAPTMKYTYKADDVNIRDIVIYTPFTV